MYKLDLGAKIRENKDRKLENKVAVRLRLSGETMLCIGGILFLITIIVWLVYASNTSSYDSDYGYGSQITVNPVNLDLVLIEVIGFGGIGGIFIGISEIIKYQYGVYNAIIEEKNQNKVD
ncbi:MAG: hypothetical protein ACLSAO_08695 [Anaerovoracaceae bacterium]